jgi:hypothetical protein
MRSYSNSTNPTSPPLLPSVQVLLHTHNLSVTDITPTGPKSNILKTDVLAAIGSIPKSVPAEEAKRTKHLTHLDLSNIVLATPAAAEATRTSPPPATAVESVEDEELLPLSIPVSLAPLLALQQKLSQTLGTAPPLSTLLARAISLANTALPISKTTASADDLFDALLSTPSNPFKVSDGKYIPLVANATELPISDLEDSEEDIYDILTSPLPLHSSSKRAKYQEPVVDEQGSDQPGAINVFALLVPPIEEKRAMTFLERLRHVLEASPGRLIGL